MAQEWDEDEENYRQEMEKLTSSPP